MGKDLVSSKKICSSCGEEIKKRQDYVAFAKNFKIGEENIYDLLTKSYEWEVKHNPCPPHKTNDIKEK